MKKLVICLLLLLAAVGCGSWRSPLSLMRAMNVSPDLVGVISSPLEWQGQALAFKVVEVWDGDHPSGVERWVRAYGPDLQNKLLGDVAVGDRVELRGGWQSADGSPMYFSAQEAWKRGAPPKQWAGVLMQAAQSSASDLAPAPAAAPVQAEPVAAAPVPSVTIVDPAPASEPKRPALEGCEEFLERMLSFQAEDPPNTAAAVALARKCVR